MITIDVFPILGMLLLIGAVVMPVNMACFANDSLQRYNLAAFISFVVAVLLVVAALLCFFRRLIWT